MKRSIYLVLVIAIAVLAFESNGRAVLRFIDRFEYVANRTESGAANAFRQAGWSHAKTQQADTGAGGYLYTTTSIPGYTGAFPGGGSRVLAIEALPATLQRQTDFYLQLGDGSANYIPGDVWFQFWIYPQNYGNQRSRYGTRNKFLYVCNDAYPCHSHLWMVGQGSNVYSATNSTPLGDPSNGEFFWNMSSASGVSTIDYANGDPWSRDQLGQNTTEWMRANRWTLVKMRFRSNSTTANGWEVWLRPQGGTWTKVANFVVGSTPGFTWNVPGSSVGGHRQLRMPTTVGGPSAQWYDYWMYMDDFAMATTEADLPVYADDRLPRAPTNLRIVPGALDELAFLQSPAAMLKSIGLTH